MLDQDLFLERILRDDGLLTQEQLDEARLHMSKHRVDLVEALVSTNTLAGRQVAVSRAALFEVPFVEIGDYEVCLANSGLVPRSIAERYCLFPLFLVDGVLTLAMDDPMNLDAMDQVRQVAKCEVDAVLSERGLLKALIARAYSLGHDQQRSAPSREESGEQDEAEVSQPVIAAVDQMMGDALDMGASDIHINPDDGELHLRYRIDGELQEKQGPSLSMHPAIVQRIKVMAHLDLTQTRRPQDGKFRFRHHGQLYDVRVSCVPTVCGENVVMRLLATTKQILSFEQLGVAAPIVAKVSQKLDSPYGMLIVCGPTGSGKTTTLYTALSKLNDPSSNVMTIEDPVEIRLPYARQIQTHAEIGLTFASALRSILRQDPDVILVGEIRDEETAGIALQAALTGHMVLTTLHTNDAAGAVSRLLNFEAPAFVVNSAVLGILAQRLVRRVCQHCVKPHQPEAALLERFGLKAGTKGFVTGEGCARCGQTGFRGRLGLYEFLEFTPAVQALVDRGGKTNDIRNLAVKEGMRLMWQDGLDKAQLGQTTLLEVAKVASIIAVADHDSDIMRMAG
jgi:type IV pilus assembly protein PilB